MCGTGACGSRFDVVQDHGGAARSRLPGTSPEASGGRGGVQLCVRVRADERPVCMTVCVLGNRMTICAHVHTRHSAGIRMYSGLSGPDVYRGAPTCHDARDTRARRQAREAHAC